MNDNQRAWTQHICSACKGTGAFWDYHVEDVGSCRSCMDGTYWISPSGTRIAAWPGGPFIGTWVGPRPQETLKVRP